MRNLRRTPDVERLSGVIPLGKQAPRLDRDRGLPADHRVHLDHVRRGAKCRRGVAEQRGQRGDLVRLPTEQLRRSRAASGPCVADRREFGVVDCNEVGCVLGQVWIVGDHDRHRLTYVADMALGQHRLQVGLQGTGVGADSHRNRWHADVGAGQDRAYARKLQRVACIDGTQNGMRDRRADHAHPELAWALLVVGEMAGARKQPGILEPPHAAADVAHQPAARASAAARTARRMPWYPVHRHRFDATTSRISSSEGNGVSRRNAVTSIKKPGVQNPHCRP